ncbi:MAG: T9SS type A sorting domain-containing protein, partial [Candidatus Marinimicrobia bacterium]|nr:T9SS type A sorting domain-containing protein [Candidatus Neomarinimicrobiota bacterium]
PFNPTTHIQFSVGIQSIVSLQIFNINGVLIETLFDHATYSNGTHSIQWNASHRPSGVYFTVLNINGHTQIQKMGLVK